MLTAMESLEFRRSVSYRSALVLSKSLECPGLSRGLGILGGRRLLRVSWNRLGSFWSVLHGAFVAINGFSMVLDL
jgi:hypothetical protein